jgi:hypothetical protein
MLNLNPTEVLKMKLDRNLNQTGKGKYALVNLRKIEGDPRTAADLVAAIQSNPEAVEFSSEDEFCVIKFKDKYAQAALHAYAVAASEDDIEYAAEVGRLAARSGPAHPLCKRPD